ncbi:exosome complex component MTR3 [Prorops nasuta]|uniref:exosome complex component MTR3 n=1 Tax=Prorops nasuta TaxID=863751 RepID=UPI0034CFA474
MFPIDGTIITHYVATHHTRLSKTPIDSDLKTQTVNFSKLDELRNMFVKAGIVTQAKGSAYIELGNTKAICSVFDPREIPNKTDYSDQGKLYCEFKYAAFSCTKRKVHQQDAEEKENSLILQRALEPAVCLQEFPNFQVDCYTIILDNGGSALAAAIMAASLALANAGIQMFGIVTASTMAIHNDVLMVNPTDEEEMLCLNVDKESENKEHGLVTLASLSQHNQITEIVLKGNMEVSTIVNVSKRLTEANVEISPVLQQCLVKSVVKAFKHLN